MHGGLAWSRSEWPETGRQLARVQLAPGVVVHPGCVSMFRISENSSPWAGRPAGWLVAGWKRVVRAAGRPVSPDFCVILIRLHLISGGRSSTILDLHLVGLESPKRQKKCMLGGYFIYGNFTLGFFPPKGGCFLGAPHHRYSSPADPSQAKQPGFRQVEGVITPGSSKYCKGFLCFFTCWASYAGGAGRYHMYTHARAWARRPRRACCVHARSRRGWGVAGNG